MKSNSYLPLVFFLAAHACAAPLQHPLVEPPAVAASPAANLFLKAAVTVNRYWDDRVPAFAVDGAHAKAGDHWAAENIPVWLTVDMGGEKELNLVRFWPYWDGRRYYQYKIEGSMNGKTWQMLADRTTSTEKGSAAGFTHTFPPRKMRYVRTTLTHNSAGAAPGGHIVEIQGFLSDAPGLHGAVANIDRRYGRGDIPTGAPTKTCRLSAWAGERVNAQFLLWAVGEDMPLVSACPADLVGSQRSIPASAIDAHWVRYTRVDGKPCADILDPAGCLDIPGGTLRPLWLAIDVPGDAAPGMYHAPLVVRSFENGREVRFALELEVLAHQLPEPADWAFHLDLWQNPYAVARYHRVEPWSDAHTLLMKPLLTRLAEAGQKVLTCSMLHQPWGAQTFDPFESMIGWTRSRSGAWTYNYDVFDRWVELGASCGLDGQINCYSMIPWSNRFRYYDCATRCYRTLVASPGSDAYENHWRPFLKDFEQHLREKGWLERTTIAMDERPEKLMATLMAFLKDAAPGIKISSAANYATKITDSIHDLSIAIGHAHIASPEFLAGREKNGQRTTFYVCCGPKRPNTFTFSPPAESEWLGLHAAAHGFSGFLRWAYCSWVEDPLVSTDYVRWPSGDCFLVYPGNRSSIRFERLRDGIEEYEKLRILRQAAAKNAGADIRAAAAALDQTLAGVTYATVRKEDAAVQVKRVRTASDKLARLLSL